ncbi:MAG: nuclear transport factor 2 family protein [Rhizorhabdus sp.]|uniref:nuclear transport factor 2 family protein n=1 Tax=Rhizorhabdus sp. TaxID=1968843 RepID=UPI001B6593A3|nr:nuclear transport factor 2 family protein [Rhizorhabdus sp.]MBP8234009.1 nuclear transport factor 2 family protein [Rhizorhabdus sp.]
MDALELLIAKDAIRDLQSRYMRGQDRLDAQMQHDCFWPDATTDYGIFKGSGHDFVAFAQDLLKGHKANQHLIGQSLIEVEGDIGFGEVYYFAFHRVEIDGQDRDMIIAGRYVDRYERRDGVWKFAHRTELVDWGRMHPAADGFLADLTGILMGARGAEDRSSQRDWLRTA